MAIAVKTLKDDQGDEEFMKETEILKNVVHPNLIQVKRENHSLPDRMTHARGKGLFNGTHKSFVLLDFRCRNQWISKDDDYGIDGNGRPEKLPPRKWKRYEGISNDFFFS